MAASLNLAPGKGQRPHIQLLFKLCYDLRMIFRRLSQALLALLIGAAVSPAWSQQGGEQLAGELNKLRQQQRQLERDISQYERSFDLLRSNNAAGRSDSTALVTLQNQLQQSRETLAEMSVREANLLEALGPGPANPGKTAALLNNPDAEEVARLKVLLASYYSGEAIAAAEAAVSEAETIAAATSGAFSVDKVRLTGAEGITAIKQVTARLEENSFVTQRRELDIIFHIEVRRGTSLVSSGSHNLKSLGNAQFVSKVSLEGGSATITVRTNSWMADLDVETSSDYLVTLNLPREGEPELHIIPVQELKETRWTELPPWLPYIGTIPATPTGP